MNYEKIGLRIVFAASILGLGGCGISYTTPGRGADFAALGMTPQTQASLTEPGIAYALDRKPLANFPANIAVARLQAPGYCSATDDSYGHGRYSIVTVRSVESDNQFQRIAHLPLINGLAPMNRLLLPEELNSDRELRASAAQLHCDMLLIYTLDTTFRTSDLAAPLSVVTLGLSPTQKTHIVTTASAVLMDTRNGYIYGVDEATTRKQSLASSWNNEQAIDDARCANESAAMEQLVDSFTQTWGGVIREYAVNRPAAR